MGLPPQLPSLVIPENERLKIGTLITISLPGTSYDFRDFEAIITGYWPHGHYGEGRKWGYAENYQVYVVLREEYLVIEPKQIKEVLHETKPDS